VLSSVQVTPDQSKLAPPDELYFRIVIDVVVGGSVFRLLLIIPDDLITLFVSGSLDFKMYALFIPESTPPYEPIGAIEKNGVVSSTLNVSFALDILFII
jgi:hypothetical protein